MDRVITGLHPDTTGDRVAELSCGHEQPVRDERGVAQIGDRLACPRCDRFELPAGYQPYKQTRPFDQDTVPDALRSNHTTKPGIWGVIHVLEGRLLYVVEPPLSRELLLSPGMTAVVVPEVPHRVEPQGQVRFFVEFHRRAPR